MKKFLLITLFGFFTFCIIWYIGEVLFDKFKGQNEYSYKYNYIKNNPSINTLLIGHSHFENSINPYLMGDSVFDFAISGRWIYWDAQLAENLFPTMDNLKTVIIPIGYHLIYGSYLNHRLNDIEREHAYLYSKYMHVYYDCFPENIYFRSALYCNKMGLKYWQDEKIDSLGYCLTTGQKADWSNVPSYISSPMFTKGSYEEYKKYIIQVAKVCYENNIRFIAVTCPCANCYIEKTCEGGLNNLYAIVDSVREHYPIEYKCYLDDKEFRADSLYFDCSHLNSIGADKFAIRVKNDFGL